MSKLIAAKLAKSAFKPPYFTNPLSPMLTH